jgi:hypothetical protein
MTTTDTDVHGPIDFVLLEFPRDRLAGEASRLSSTLWRTALCACTT